MSIKVFCAERLKETVTFAKKFGGKSLDSLKRSLEYLATYGGKNQTVCKLYQDFVPYSFGFAMFRRLENGTEEFWFAGGLICHGAGSNGMEEMSITLSPQNYVNWQIHT